jgi:3-oxoacyl-[acyl-carrier protein] reductase/2-hydroxycyclohexanecarboxyl-CoA dehydrogenase
MTPRRLENRTAFLTAAAQGIGLACALRLAAEGAEAWITDRDDVALEAAKSEAASKGLAIHAVRADSTDPAALQAAMERAHASRGRLDILVNNAGGSLHTPYLFEQESDEDWRRVMELNVMGAVWAARAGIPLLKRSPAGRIVNFGSKAGRFGSLIAGANYAAAKGAIAALTRQLAMELGPSGITVNCVCPGIVLTRRTKGLWESRRSEEERARIVQEIPLRRHATVDDISGVVAFLASDDAAFITGATLDVNGGQGMA